MTDFINSPFAGLRAPLCLHFVNLEPVLMLLMLGVGQ